MQKYRVFVKIKEFFVKFYNRNKKLFFCFIALVLICLVGLIASISRKNLTDSTKEEMSSVSVDDYTLKVESKIKNILLSLNSVSKAEVFVMVDSSPRAHYLVETEKNKTGENEIVTETIVFEKNGSSSKPIEVCVTMPKIVGVLIFINKVDSSTKVSITNALAVVLNVDVSCISILQEK